MNPEQAKKLNGRKLALNILRVSDLLTAFMDEILVREIDTIMQGVAQCFSMRIFAPQKLNNEDEHLFVDNMGAILDDIVSHYNNEGWYAVHKGDGVVSIKIA